MKKFIIVVILKLNVLNTLSATLVQLPDANTLIEKLCNEGLEDLIEQTTLIEEFANKEFEVDEIVQKTVGFLDFYKIVAEEKLSSQVQMQRRKLIELLIGNNIEALEELNKYDL